MDIKKATVTLEELHLAIGTNDVCRIHDITRQSRMHLPSDLRPLTLAELSEYRVDNLAQILIPDDDNIPHDVKAITTLGNGNCLYNAISLQLVGMLSQDT